ncbi:MAG: chromosome segregation protein SMC, partial [Pirellulales bacterium]|nr:chromosome segregation protein SMC [Pirellulales bacterium]
RSGEGEYQINHQPCRLRDIRELFAGTGIATEAYSVIEQGKVDVMLQASPRDRRILFEEAAGISRFKIKKVEAARRLERVDQNLLRLSDIVEEVDNRLRTIRSQASKARRYREHTERLQALRTQVAVTDWRQFTQELEELQQKIRSLTDRRDRLASQIELDEVELQRLEGEVADAEERIHAAEADRAEVHRRIAELELTVAHQQILSDDLAAEISRQRHKIAAMSVRVGADQQRIHEDQETLMKAEEEEQFAAVALEAEEDAFRQVAARLNETQKSSESKRAAHMDAMRTAASLGSQISVLRSQLTSAKAAERRCEEQFTLVQQDAQKLADSLLENEALESDLATKADECGRQFRAIRQELAERRQCLGTAQKQVAELIGRRTGAEQRADVLEELESRLEGVGSGVRDVLRLARREPDGPFREVRGLVADLLQVSVDIAPVVELALGEKAHLVVLVTSKTLLDALMSAPALLPGRVGFLRLDVPPPTLAIDRIDLMGEPGVIDRLDRLVDAEPAFLPLVRRLLGRTWLVEDMPTAIRLAEGIGRGLDFVTRDRQRLSSDGTLIMGPRQATTGLISRRSELRSLRPEIERLTEQLARHEADVAKLENDIGVLDRRQESIAPKHTELTGMLSEQRLKTVSMRDRAEQLKRQAKALEIEWRAAQDQGESAASDLELSERDRSQVQSQIAHLEAQLEEDTIILHELREAHTKHQHQATERRVAAATSRQRREALAVQLNQLVRDQEERTTALVDANRRLEERKKQLQSSQATLLDCTSRIAGLFLESEEKIREIAERIQQRDLIRDHRSQKMSILQTQRRELRQCEQQRQEVLLAAAHIDQQREGLVERLREDYGIELSDAGSDEHVFQIETCVEIEQEIQDLRRKIANIGAVNLQALEELDELEIRAQTLSNQYQDLALAKASLEQIIDRINTDSRRMFAATLDTVRKHFQELFRKLFGGGQADIVLDSGEDIDVLESGIEIVARPPGKDPRSISLLSGGEKTLTCVALLLAIFKSHPSPFCVLDEVDAALDEANIERFASVLGEFLSTTQFIVITHSKKTMSHANTLYGVTMQESGISKQVSVRFEDVSDDGTILQVASDDTQAA